MAKQISENVRRLALAEARAAAAVVCELTDAIRAGRYVPGMEAEAMAAQIRLARIAETLEQFGLCIKWTGRGDDLRIARI